MICSFLIKVRGELLGHLFFSYIIVGICAAKGVKAFGRVMNISFIKIRVRQIYCIMLIVFIVKNIPNQLKFVRIYCTTTFWQNFLNGPLVVSKCEKNEMYLTKALI